MSFHTDRFANIKSNLIPFNDWPHGFLLCEVKTFCTTTCRTMSAPLETKSNEHMFFCSKWMFPQSEWEFVRVKCLICIAFFCLAYFIIRSLSPADCFIISQKKTGRLDSSTISCWTSKWISKRVEWTRQDRFQDYWKRFPAFPIVWSIGIRFVCTLK